MNVQSLPFYQLICDRSDICNTFKNMICSSPERDRVVSNLAAKIGEDYRYQFSNTTQATLEVGYQANEYINGIDIIRSNYIPGAQKMVGLETTSFTFRGPYATVILHA